MINALVNNPFVANCRIWVQVHALLCTHRCCKYVQADSLKLTDLYFVCSDDEYMCTDAQLEKEEDLKKVLRGDRDKDKEKNGETKEKLTSLRELTEEVG